MISIYNKTITLAKQIPVLINYTVIKKDLKKNLINIDKLIN